MNPRIKIIKDIAISKTEDTSIQDWIRIDRERTIETIISDLLGKTEQKAIDHNLSEDTVNNEIGAYVAYICIEASILIHNRGKLIQNRKEIE